jgi:hypothetical protein
MCHPGLLSRWYDSNGFDIAIDERSEFRKIILIVMDSIHPISIETA